MTAEGFLAVKPRTQQMTIPAEEMVAGKEGSQLSRLLDEGEAADFLHCSVAFLRRCRLFMTGPGYSKLGRLVRYRIDDLEAYVTDNRVVQAA